MSEWPPAAFRLLLLLLLLLLTCLTGFDL